MNVGRQKFGEVLANHIDRCQREPSWDMLQQCEIWALHLRFFCSCLRTWMWNEVQNWCQLNESLYQIISWMIV
jgi:hypothetical protein